MTQNKHDAIQYGQSTVLKQDKWPQYCWIKNNYLFSAPVRKAWIFLTEKIEGCLI